MWKVYTQDSLYCNKVKKLLNKESIQYEEIPVNNSNKQYLKDKGCYTVPQVWNHRDEHIGGYEELTAYMTRTIWSGK